MRVIPYVIYYLLAGMHQVFGIEITSIWGCSINLAALMVLLIGYYKSELAGLWFAFGVGLVVGAGRPDLLGWSTAIFALTGISAFHVSRRLNLDSIYARLLLILGGVTTINTLLLFLDGTEGFWYRVITQSIPGAIYTTLVGLLFFLFKDGRITAARLKSIF